MRKYIFRNELEYVFMKNKIGKFDQDKILSAIFENHLEISKQFILKEEIKSIDDLRSKLSEIIKDEVSVGAINTLFNVQDDLELPSGLGNLFLRNEKIAVFVGAGISKLIGFPLWDELANSAIEYLSKKELINYFELQKIQKEILSPKQKMTIFHEIIPKGSPESKRFYEEIFSKSNNCARSPYGLLLQFDWVKITTNIDKEFSKAYTSIQHTRPTASKDISLTDLQTLSGIEIVTKNFNSETNISLDAIYHIHGSIENIEEAVLTTKDYVNTYYYEDSELKSFLDKIFSEYNVIFVGYGLDEFEVLERILHNGNHGLNRYILLPIYLHELNFFRIKQKYFRNLRVEPIRYYLDFNGHSRLYDLLDSWLQQIKDKRSQDYFQKIRNIDEVLD